MGSHGHGAERLRVVVVVFVYTCVVFRNMMGAFQFRSATDQQTANFRISNIATTPRRARMLRAIYGRNGTHVFASFARQAPVAPHNRTLCGITTSMYGTSSRSSHRASRPFLLALFSDFHHTSPSSAIPLNVFS